MNSAVLSPCLTYRYSLTRWIEAGAQSGGNVLWVMANPSIADAERDDATIRRVVSFSSRWGFRTATVVNVYAFRATHPKHLLAAHHAGIDVQGPHNQWHIMRAARFAGRIVLAWGACFSGAHWDQAKADAIKALQLRHADTSLMHLGLTRSGEPRHPLYLAQNTDLKPFEG